MDLLLAPPLAAMSVSLLKKVVPVTALLVFVFAVGELSARFWMYFLATPKQVLVYSLYGGDKPEHSLSLYKPHPYLNYALSPDYRSLDGKNKHNSLGYRGDEVTVPKPDNAFRIVLMGGSTIYTWGVDDYKKSLPYQLGEILKNDYGYTNVEVINAGVPGYNSWENLIDLEFRILDLKPDLVIFHYGVNDVFARMVESKAYKSDNTGRRKPFAKPAVSWWERSILVRILAVRLGWSFPPTIGDLVNVPGQIELLQLNAKPLLGAALLQQNPPTYFERNVYNAVLLAKFSKIKVILMTNAFVASSFHKYLRDAMDEHNGILKEISEKLGVLALDFKKDMPEESSFWFEDGIHFTEIGARKAAELLANFLHRRAIIVRD